jgi:hypothetical protein
MGSQSEAGERTGFQRLSSVVCAGRIAEECTRSGAKSGIETDLPEGRRVLRNQFGLVQGKANAIEPAKRPVYSMVPTIILKDGKLFITAGAQGRSRTPTTSGRPTSAGGGKPNCE